MGEVLEPSKITKQHIFCYCMKLIQITISYGTMENSTGDSLPVSVLSAYNLVLFFYM